MVFTKDIKGKDNKMKNLIYILIISLGVGMFISAASAHETRSNNESYRIEKPGLNFRITEFTPKTAPEKTCIIVGDFGLFCFDKEK